MKKITVALCMCLIFVVGCCEHKSGCLSNSEPMRVKNVDNQKSYSRIILDGHTYIRYGRGYQAGITHDPDCCKKISTE